MRARMAREGLDPVGGSAEQFRSVIKRDVENWRRVVKEVGITVDG
jgi:tripartite-type tricarboxylate transporter receptor subunit TctC